MKTAKDVFFSFDCEKFAAKVAPLYKVNGWKWGTVNSEDGIPTEQDIAATLHSIAWECLREIEKNAFSNHSCCSTGRLQVRIARYENRWTGALELCPEWQSI